MLFRAKTWLSSSKCLFMQGEVLFVCLDDLDFCVRVTHSYFRGQRENSLSRLQMLLNLKTPLGLLSMIY